MPNAGRFVGSRAAALGLVVSFICLLATGSEAFPPGIRLSQLGHTSWKVQDGVFNPPVGGLTQTTDGYLWIGTRSGLVRFDGTHFQAISPPPEFAKSPSQIISMLATGDGSLWVGLSARGVIRMKEGRFTSYAQIKGRVNEMVEGDNGDVWIAQSRLGEVGGTPLCVVLASGSRCLAASEGIASPYLTSLANGAGGSLWLGQKGGVAKWEKEHATIFEVSSLKASSDPVWPEHIVADGDCVLVAFNAVGRDRGLQRLCSGVWQPYTAPGLDGSGVRVAALRFATDGALWIGTAANGLYRVRDGVVENYRLANGLSGDAVLEILEDREGSLWVLTSQGLDRFRALKVTTFSLTEGLAAEGVRSVLATSNGQVWIGNSGSLDLMDGGQVSSITTAAGLPGQAVTSLFEDHQGVLWVGVDSQLFVYDRRKFSAIQAPSGPVLGMVIGIAEDAMHDVWAVTSAPYTLTRIRNRKVVEQIAARGPIAGPYGSLPGGGVLVAFPGKGWTRYRDGQFGEALQIPVGPYSIGDVLNDADGTLWASSRSGLLTLKDGRFKLIGEESGLPCTFIYSIAKTPNGVLWLTQSCGYVRIPADQVASIWKEEKIKLSVEILDALDGAQPGRAAFSPSMSAAPDGTLWIANGQVLQHVDPAHLSTNSVLPPVRVDRLVADRVAYPTNNAVQLPAGTRDLQIDFAALSLVIPQKVQVKYKLEGWDREWQNPEGRGQAFYTNLRPGQYTFHVKASNNDGLWNDEGAQVSFAIKPAFYQTGWFVGVIALLVVCMLYIAYWLRVRQITANVRNGLLERLSERERIARELHDSFFQGIQGLLLRFNTATAKMRADDPARPSFVEALQQSDRVMREGRELVLDLRATTSGELELSSNLMTAGEQFKVLYPAGFVSVVTGRARPLQTACAEELYRLGREALYNAFRHAGAKNIESEVNFGADALVLRIRDDGGGIDADVLKDGLRSGHWGLPGMQERAKTMGARMKLWSREGSGTEVEVVVPAKVAYVNYRPGSLLSSVSVFLSKISNLKG